MTVTEIIGRQLRFSFLLNLEVLDPSKTHI